MSTRSTRGREHKNPVGGGQQHPNRTRSRSSKPSSSGSQSRSSNASKASHSNKGEIDKINSEIIKMERQLRKLDDGSFDMDGSYSAEELRILTVNIGDQIHLYKSAIRLLKKEPDLKKDLADIDASRKIQERKHTEDKLVIAREELAAAKKKCQDLESKIEGWNKSMKKFDDEAEDLIYVLKDNRGKIEAYLKNDER